MRRTTLLVLGLLANGSVALAHAHGALPFDRGKAKARITDRLHDVLEQRIHGASLSREYTRIDSIRTQKLTGDRYLVRFVGGNGQSGYLSGVSGKAIVSLKPGKRGLPVQTIRRIEIVRAPFAR
jgi:ABC-type protease/lipase transport system fused ATPase/permease subunit